jgi:beta-fructofuranosidase
MAPAEELALLRYHPRKREGFTIEADAEVPLDDVKGSSFELRIEFAPGTAAQFGVKVACSPDGEEQTLIFYDQAEKKLKIDTTCSGLGEGPKSVEAAPFELAAGESLVLRVFVDASLVEIFANERQAVTRQIYPTRKDSVGVALFSRGGATEVRSIEAWEMAPANPY